MIAGQAITCLSPAVHNMICNLGFENDVSHNINSIVSGEHEVCWSTVTNHVHYAESGEGHDVDYIGSVRSLGPLCKAVHLHLLALSKEQFEENYGLFFQWTNNAELFLETFDVLKNLQAAAIALSLMKLTSCLEQALGNVYLLIGKECPFLLRDLLSSMELTTVFGQSVMDVLKVFLGSPKSLNLRNILWHGFASPQEIPSKYCSMLLLLTAGLGQLLKTYLLKMNTTLVHRPCITFTNLKELNVFPDVTRETLSVIEELVEVSNFIIKPMLPFWRTLVAAFKECRYADCVILTLSQLETGLRLVFTRVNKCPSRLFTAESTAFYTTFDKILAKHLSDGELNQLPLTLGEPAMENAVIRPLINCASCYRSQFHPVARLGIQVLDCVKSIKKWPQLPVPPVEQMRELTGSTGAVAPDAVIPEMSEVLSLLLHHMPPDYYNLEDMGNGFLTDKWLLLLTDLCSMPMRTLYCPRPVLEAAAVLRKITTQCHLVSEQVIASARLRYTQWVDKALRSRQRHNYIRMVKSITFLSPMLRLLLMMVALNRINLYHVCKKTTSECQQYLKYLKSILQYTENLATYTSPEKNKWDETLDLSQRVLIKIKMYDEKKQLC
ncbi:endoplasmic reticulum membrane-associated RNA degradation protein isoform X3 [Rhinatrema bivittatum]|uniref:endoplasmic reticulum membrane-associated RNA degradation protein isoform X3 n=1 Tax=Rhinatrema bivittatum TaxID=194408 RepID=UPI00112684D9|nr:endoplasmic reticulum membrane-associated RNA degradation protein isoform X3 [Rhinatrema bivittatum]